MFKRFVTQELQQALQRAPAVVLLGPRQVGKTTLAMGVPGGTYLDLESSEDLAKLANTEQYLRSHIGSLVVLDEVQRMPALFEPLRGLIDHARRAGYKTGQYLLLGSASLALLQRSSETLAGRIAFVELGGLHRLEVPSTMWPDVWLRGGFPESLTADSLEDSLRWRRDFIRTYLERDIGQFAPRIAADKLRRFWIMLAHLQASTINMAQLARNLEVDQRTAGDYLDLLVDLLLVRRLPAWHRNEGKRLIKAPKVYIRDSGLVHSLLGITDTDSLLTHPVMGASWEAHAIESLLAVAPSEVTASHYRSSAGAEIDLILTWPDGQQWAIEIKRSTTPKLERGFYSACEDLQPSQKWVIYGGAGAFPFASDIEALPLEAAMKRLAGQAAQ